MVLEHFLSRGIVNLDNTPSIESQGFHLYAMERVSVFLPHGLGQSVPDARSEIRFQCLSFEPFEEGFLELTEFFKMPAGALVGHSAGTKPLSELGAGVIHNDGHPRSFVTRIGEEGQAMAVKLKPGKIILGNGLILGLFSNLGPGFRFFLGVCHGDCLLCGVECSSAG